MGGSGSRHSSWRHTPSLSDDEINGHLSPNPPKSRGISAGAWVKDAARWRCGYDADAEAF